MGERTTGDEGSEPVAGEGPQDAAGWQVVAPGVMLRAGSHGSGALPGTLRADLGPEGSGGVPRAGGVPARGRHRVLVPLGVLALLGVAGVLAAGTVGGGAREGAVATTSLPAVDPSAGAHASPRPSGASSQSGPPAEALGGSGAGVGEDWWSVLGVLDARRQRALTDRDTSALAEYLVPGSPAWHVDSGLIADLLSQDLRPLGLETHLVAIESVEVGGAAPAAVNGSSSEEGGHSPSAGAGPPTERATAVLVDSRSAYSLVDAQGVVVEVVESPGTQRWEVTLSRVPGSPPPRAHASVQVTDEQRQPEELPASPLPPEGGDAGWRIAQVSPMP